MMAEDKPTSPVEDEPTSPVEDEPTSMVPRGMAERLEMKKDEMPQQQLHRITWASTASIGANDLRISLNFMKQPSLSAWL